MSKSESGIIVITFSDKKNKFTYQEDMENKSFLQDNNLSYAKNFKARDYSGKVTQKMQAIGLTGKSSRLATAFIHIISDEDDYNNRKEGYLSELVGNLVKNMNEKASQRTMQFQNIVFKMPITPLLGTMKTEPLSNFFTTEDCLQLFIFLYNKEIEDYADTEQLFVDFPHITKEFLGSDSKSNRELLKEAHKKNSV